MWVYNVVCGFGCFSINVCFAYKMFMVWNIIQCAGFQRHMQYLWFGLSLGVWGLWFGMHYVMVWNNITCTAGFPLTCIWYGLEYRLRICWFGSSQAICMSFSALLCFHAINSDVDIIQCTGFHAIILHGSLSNSIRSTGYGVNGIACKRNGWMV